MNIAIITGASSGIGREFVKQITTYEKQLDEIWVIARRKDRLEELQKEVSCKLRIFVGDLLSKAFLAKLEDTLITEEPNVRVLVNSAGFGKNGSFIDILKEDRHSQPQMLELNCNILLQLIQIVLPFMRGNNHIINLSSGSAFCPQPYFTVYAATKSFVLSLSRGLASELKKQKIYVTAVCPGPVQTEFFLQKGMQTASWKEPFMASAELVVKKALKDAYKNRTTSVYGPAMKMMRIITKILPKSWIIWITGLLQKGN